MLRGAVSAAGPGLALFTSGACSFLLVSWGRRGCCGRRLGESGGLGAAGRAARALLCPALSDVVGAAVLCPDAVGPAAPLLSVQALAHPALFRGLQLPYKSRGQH